MSRPTPEVVEVRADTADGWAHLCQEFGAGSGRPICQPSEPWLAVYGRISPTQVGWPAYCHANDAEAIAAAREEKRIEAWAAAEDHDLPPREFFASDEEYHGYIAEQRARQAERDAEHAEEQALLTPEERAAEAAAEAAMYAKDRADWDAKLAAQWAAAAAAEDARLDALHGPGAAARQHEALRLHNERWRERDRLAAEAQAAEEAEMAEAEADLAEYLAIQAERAAKAAKKGKTKKDPGTMNGHDLNGHAHEPQLRLVEPPVKVVAVEPPDETPDERRDRQRAENASIGDEQSAGYHFPAWSLEDFIANAFVIDTDKPSVAYIAGGQVSVRLMPTFVENFSHCEMVPPGTKKKVATVSVWRKLKERRVLAGATHSVGFPRFIEDGRLYNGRRVINTWSPRLLVEAHHAGLKDFVDHIRFVFKDRADEFMLWLAHCEQKPWELPHQGWLSICETHGIGRNWIASVLTRVWAGEVAASLDLGALVGGAFNNRISGKRLAVVDEINLSGSGMARHSIMARRRQLMTEEVRRINGKFALEHDEINVLRWLVFSNHADAMPVDTEDRRDEVVFGPEQPKEPSYYTRLYGLLGQPRFIQAVRWHLAKLDISGYSAGKRAVLSEDKMRAVKASRSGMCNAAAEWIEDNPLRTFATMSQMTDDVDYSAAPQQWKHVVRELKLAQVVCEGRRKHSVGYDSARKVYMVRPPTCSRISLGKEPGTVELDARDYERMLTEVREWAEWRPS